LTGKIDGKKFLGNLEDNIKTYLKMNGLGGVHWIHAAQEPVKVSYKNLA
jgi:hypothetical protein